MVRVMKYKTFFILFYISSVLLMVYSLYLIIRWHQENRHNNSVKEQTLQLTTIEEVKESTKQEKYPYIKTDFSNLLSINDDVRGWLQVPNTNINYPVVQADNNDYYLNHNFNKEENSAGWIFLDFRNDLKRQDTNIIIYGHNRLDSSMFGTLSKTHDEKWNKENKYIFFNTTNSMNTYQIFSVYTVNANDFINSINFKTEEEYEEYIINIKRNSIIEYDIDVSTTDKIITLYTCAKNNIDRTILHAKLIQEKALGD